MYTFYKDLEDIGIDEPGHRLRLAKAAKQLPSLSISVNVPVRQIHSI